METTTQQAPDLTALDDLPQGKELISNADLAKRLGVAHKTVRRWQQRGLENVRLRARTMNGSKIGVDPEDVKEFFRLVDKRKGFSK